MGRVKILAFGEVVRLRRGISFEFLVVSFEFVLPRRTQRLEGFYCHEDSKTRRDMGLF
jgi:hypothetical protein